MGALAAVWGWLEQKKEAVGLLRKAVTGASARLNGLSSYERRQLIAAAHTTIVIASFFESLSSQLSKSAFAKLKITDAEKRMLALGKWPTSGQPLIEYLYSAEVPSPSATDGFESNVNGVKEWARQLGDNCENFLRGLNTTDEDLRIEIQWQDVQEKTAERYRSYYLALASSVPEFMVWALLVEHEATRSAIRVSRTDMQAAIEVNRQALARVEAFLALQTTKSDELTDLRLVVARANQGMLDQPIVPTDAERYGVPVQFPKISDSYVNPRYRIARMDEAARPADEQWWDAKPSNDDLDLALAAYVMTPNSTRVPLLILGHPGAGKSLLSKVFAARLPSSGYIAARVPLRQVGANAPIVEQVQQALNLATNHRVEWWRLVEQGRGAIRVVILDGLDELLQASSSDRSGYLQEVMEFQRIEAEQERPVVVVTSRTVVADRVDIPMGATIVNLDYFNNSDIGAWLKSWNAANRSLIQSGTVRPLLVTVALLQPELARQPLLLLMLALYSADPAFPALDAGLSTANLYERLLDNFARREVAKKAERKLIPDELERLTRDQLERLSIAALAMFNRKRQDIRDVELGADIAALIEDGSARSAAELGQRLIGEFFFVHAAEARARSVIEQTYSSEGRQSEVTRRSYEFLHATFGEYLVVSRVVDELVDVAESAFAGRHGPREPGDELLFALLSHQPLAGRRSAVNFATELFANHSRTERSRVLALLETLIGSYRRRHGSDRYGNYRPTAVDRVRQLAAYSANLVTLRVVLESESSSVPLARLMDERDDALQAWRVAVSLWHSGLDADGLQAVIASFALSDGSVRFAPNRDVASISDMFRVWSAQLTDEVQLEAQLRFGMAVNDGISYYNVERSDWPEMMESWLIPYIAGVSDHSIVTDPPSGVPSDSVSRIAVLVMRLLRVRGGSLELEASLIRLLFALPRVFEVDKRALALAVMRHSVLVSMIPELADPRVFGDGWYVICMERSAKTVWHLPKGSPAEAEAGALWNWRLHFLKGGALPGEIEPAITEMLKIYSADTLDG